MARPRVYRRQARCPECGSNRIPKDGHSKSPPSLSLRRLRPSLHSRKAACHRPSAANKERAVSRHREGSSLRAVGRVFGVSIQAVTLWLK